MMTNAKVRQMAEVAKIHWDFDEDTDPHGDVKRGIDYLAEDGDWDQDIIDANVESEEDWDGLEDWATRLGQQIAS